MNKAPISHSDSLTDNNYKIAVLGSGAVGKSSLTIRYLHGNFTEDYSPTLQEVFRKVDNIDGNPANLEITDTAGQEDYVVMQDQWIRDAKAFLLVYAINKEDSFEEIKNIKRRIDKVKPKAPIVIVGNKADMEQHRKVDAQLAQELAKSYGAAFIETSAKTGLNCEEPFRTVVRALRIKEQPKPKSGTLKKKGVFDSCTLI